MEVTLHYPSDAELLVKKGKKVSPGEPFYSVQEHSETVVEIASKLRIKPQDIFQCVKVVVGQDVDKGLILAEKKQLLGSKKILCAYSGTVSHINHESGTIHIHAKTDGGCIFNTFFSGTITEIHSKKHTLTVDIGDAFSFDLQNVTDQAGGALSHIDASAMLTATSEEISDRIILIDSVQSHNLNKLEALDASGILYLDGTPETQLPSAQFVKKEDFSKLESGKYAFVLVTKVKGYAYT